MLERIDRLVFYFTIDCANCHNKLHVSHVAVEEQKGMLVCSLCGRNVKVPDFENLALAAKNLNLYLGDNNNAKYIKLIMNEKFKIEDATPAAAH